MSKSFCSLGLMSGTSGDGIDASIIQSDGDNEYQLILDKYFKYNEDIYNNIHNLKDKINNLKDLRNFSEEVEVLEKEITLFHAESVNKIIKATKQNIDFVGFHGQTIYHNVEEKISRQLGDGKLLSKLTTKTVIYNFRKNDLVNGGQGAPLTPIFHRLLKNKYKFKIPLLIVNIGGIANVTTINSDGHMQSNDIGPGNCLIDKWIRMNSGMKYDEDGKVAKSGKINKTILNKALKKYEHKNSLKSYDIKDFDISFVKELSLEDGAATLTEYTSEILKNNLRMLCKDLEENIILSGGGRKNKLLVNSIEEKINIQLKSIDEFGIDGDFVESQAFAYLAVRSYLDLPISFPGTTGVRKPCVGGIKIKI